MLDQLLYNIIFQLSYYENNYNIPLKCIFKSMYYILSLFYIVSPGFEVVASVQEQNIQAFLSLYSLVFSEVVENFITKDYFILILNLFFIALILWLLIYNIHIKRKVKERLNKDKYSILLIKLFILSSSLIQYILIHPFLCITLLNLRNNLTSNTIQWVINDILFIIILHILTCLHQALFDYQLEVNGSEFRKINSNILENIYFIIYITQIYIYSFSDRNNLYLQSVLFLISTCTQYANIFIFKIFLDIKEVYVIMFVSSVGSMISICNIFSFVQTYFYSVLLVPFLFYLSKKTFDMNQDEIQTKPPDQLQLSELNLVICTQFQNKKLTDMLFLRKIVMMNKHIITCKNSKCPLCDKQKICYKCAINIEEESLLLFYTLLYIQEVKQRKQNYFLNEFYYFCHYLSANQQIGQNQEVQINLEQRVKLYKQFSYFKLQAFKHILKQQQFNQFSQKLLNETKESQEVSLKVAAFIKSESFNQQIKDNVLKIAQQKVALFEQFQNLSEEDLLQHVQTIISEIRKTEKVLIHLFEKFQSMKNRSMLLFFYVELVNDWLRAYDYQSFNYYDVQQAFNTSEINFNSTKMNYVTCSYENRLLRLETFSKNSPKLFGYELIEFKKIDNANVLIPECVAEVHNQYVEHLIEVGEGRYFRKKGINGIQNKNGFILPCNFFYEFYYDNEHHFRFIVFLEQMINNPFVILLIDKEKRICGISKNIFKAVNFQYSKSELSDIQRIIYGMPIRLLFSSIHFDQNGNFAPDASKLLLHFPNESAIKLFKGIGINQRMNLMKHKNNVKMYEVSYEYSQSSNYSILRLFHFQEYDQYATTLLIHQDTKSSAMIQFDINDEDLILFPYDDAQEYKIAIDSVQVIQTYRNQEELLVSKKEIDIPPQEQLLVNNSYETNENDNDQTIQMLGDVYAQQAEQQVDIQANDGQSYASSLGGLRRSQYYRKYQLIHYLTNKEILGKWISNIIILLLIYIMIQVIVIAIVTAFTNEDFGILEYFYKAIQVNHYFIEPLQKFFLTRYILQDYIIAKVYNEITANEYNQYTIFVNDTLTQQYFFLQHNFQDHFLDPLTQSFLADRYVNISQAVTYSTPIKFSTTNMTLLSAFNLLVEAFYEQYRTYVYPRSIPGTPAYSTYQYINYMLFIDSFNDVSQQIFQESKHEIEQIIRKWYIIQIPIFIIQVGVLVCLFYYVLKYKKVLENLLNLFQLTDQNSIDKDAKRLKFIISTIGNQSDLMHKYQFNVEIKEKYIENQLSCEKYYSHKDVREKKSSNIKKKQLSLYYLIIFIVFLLAQYLAIIIALQEISIVYLQKYPSTVELLKSLSDLGVYLPASYYQKELIYMWNYFSYYTSEDRDNFINQIQIAIDSIQEYQNQVYSDKQYQFSDNYLQNYQDKITQNICDILDEDNYKNFQYTCQNAMDGILIRGLRVALTKFQNELIANMELNFTGRTNYPVMEMEAAYFSSDVITLLVDGMGEDINIETKKIQTTLFAIEIIALLLSILQLYLIISPIYDWYKVKLICAKQISFILPQETIFINDHYERDLRQISIKEQLI